MGVKSEVNKKSPGRILFEDENKIADNKSVFLVLDGHLFDSNLLNAVMDVFEANNCGVEIDTIDVGGKTLDGINRPSHAVLRVFCLNPNGSVDALKKVADDAASLVPLNPRAEATFKVITPVASSSVTNVTSLDQKNILLVGAGMVANSFAEYLGRTDDNVIHVAGNVAADVESVYSEAKHGRGHVFDLTCDPTRLESLVADADVVVSLLPATLHPMIAELAINNKTNMVSASYVSPAIQAMHQRAVDAGITILNEVGLDPGMDHMSAMRIMDGVKARGGWIKHFSSVCGGLPAPECANNPLMYKFSWSPMGVLTASQNPATYLKNGEVINVEGEEMLNSAYDIFSFPTMNMECLPNRDSLAYKEIYGIESAESCFRGTLRFKGFSELMYGAKKLGLLDDAPCDGETWSATVAGLLAKHNCSDLREFYVKKCGGTAEQGVKMEQMLSWFDMLEGPLKVSNGDSRVKSLCDLLEGRLGYGEKERDMVAMAHDIVAEFPDGTLEQHDSTLLMYGDDQFSAMGRTVGVTCAIGTEMVIDGWIKEKGVLVPMTKNIYDKGLELLEKEGMKFEESCRVIRK